MTALALGTLSLDATAEFFRREAACTAASSCTLQFPVSSSSVSFPGP
ncbi:MAG: hypothetical protein QM756_29830 [Polyangiaceae bacterium]